MARPDAWRLHPGAYPFVVEVPTRWADLDMLGHINNVAMAGLFEEGRGRFNGSLKLSRATSDIRWLIGGVTLAYLAEGRYPGSVIIASGIGAVGRSSWTIYSAAFQGDVCLATCDTILVYVNGDGPTPFPPTFAETFRKVAVRRP